MYDEALQKKAKDIEALYQKYLSDLQALKKKQDRVIEDFAKALETKKMKKIRKELGLE